MVPVWGKLKSSIIFWDYEKIFHHLMFVVQVLKSYPDIAKNKSEELEGVSPQWPFSLCTRKWLGCQNHENGVWTIIGLQQKQLWLCHYCHYAIIVQACNCITQLPHMQRLQANLMFEPRAGIILYAPYFFGYNLKGTLFCYLKIPSIFSITLENYPSSFPEMSVSRCTIGAT